MSFWKKALRLVEKAAAPIADVALAATGNAEFIPLANAGISTTENLASGQSIGKSLGQGAISGAESLALQEAAGSVGLGEGNTAFNEALGITGDNPAGTGFPDIGSAVKNGLNYLSDSATSALGGAEDYLGITPSAESAVTDAEGQSVPTGAMPSTANASGTGLSASSASSDIDQTFKDLSSEGNLGQTAAPSELPPLSSGETALPQTPAPPTLPSLTASAAPASAPSSTLGTIANAAKYAIPLGGLAYQAIRGPAQPSAEDRALQVGGAATAPLLATETNSLNAYNSGQLTQPQQANVLKYVQNQQNALIQQLASQGVRNVKNDSRYISGMETIQQNALALQQQYLTASLNAGLSAAGQASGNLTNVANQQLKDDNDYQGALSRAFGSLGAAFGTDTGTTIKIGAAA